MDWSLFFKQANSAPVACEPARARTLGARPLQPDFRPERGHSGRHLAPCDNRPDKVQVKMNPGAAVSTLEIEVEILNVGFPSATREHAIAFLEETKDRVIEAAS